MTRRSADFKSTFVGPDAEPPPALPPALKRALSMFRICLSLTYKYPQRIHNTSRAAPSSLPSHPCARAFSSAEFIQTNLLKGYVGIIGASVGCRGGAASI